jgi:hypothetical protein
MSSSIWMRCAGDSEVRPLRVSPWRAVEAQHQVSTRKLVDTAEEQAVLEDLIEGAKPPDPTRGRLHYLLSTPFRYPPLRQGSRFGGRHERGIWYGADEKRTVFAEVAYYRLLFIEGSRADLGVVATPLTAFTVRVRTDRGVDLTAPPFHAHRAAISDPAAYGASRALGGAMRDAGVEVFRYGSARDTAGGANIGIFSPAAFGSAKPRGLETWHCTASREQVEFMKRDYFERGSLTFPRGDFLLDGRLPAPAP